ncbi:MAG: hypothetical protein WB709_09015 [Solirubrobacteraceae bacterium]
MSCLARAIPLGDTLGSWSEFATAIFAGVALFGAWFQLRQTRNAGLETRTHEYMQRYSSPELIPYQTVAHPLIGAALDPSDPEARTARIEKWKGMSFEKKQEVMIVMNFWEELASMYNRKLVDRTIIHEYFAGVIYDFWEQSEWLRTFIKSQYADGAGVYNEFEEMHRDLAQWDRRRRCYAIWAPVLR